MRLSTTTLYFRRYGKRTVLLAAALIVSSALGRSPQLAVILDLLSYSFLSLASITFTGLLKLFCASLGS